MDRDERASNWWIPEHSMKQRALRRDFWEGLVWKLPQLPVVDDPHERIK